MREREYFAHILLINILPNCTYWNIKYIKKGHQKCIWLIINDRADYEFMCFYRELSLTHKWRGHLIQVTGCNQNICFVRIQSSSHAKDNQSLIWCIYILPKHEEPTTCYNNSWTTYLSVSEVLSSWYDKSIKWKERKQWRTANTQLACYLGQKHDKRKFWGDWICRKKA